MPKLVLHSQSRQSRLLRFARGPCSSTRFASLHASAVCWAITTLLPVPANFARPPRTAADVAVASTVAIGHAHCLSLKHCPFSLCTASRPQTRYRAAAARPFLVNTTDAPDTCHLPRLQLTTSPGTAQPRIVPTHRRFVDRDRDV